MTTFTCPRGHKWHDEDGTETGQPPHCPICAGASDPERTTLIREGQTEVSEAGTVAPALLHAPLIPGFQIMGVLGQGGMGVVYRARQVNLKRMVGLKMLRGAAVDAVCLARFRAEAEAVAQLQHPNIVQIYEVGNHEGQPYFAMELVEGSSLALALTRTLFPLRDTAALVATLAHAVHYAHERGIIHRDLKPHNVLLQVPGAGLHFDKSADPKPVILNLQSAIPKITDFGVAKRLNTEGPTLSGAVLGTPSYMPPEQATGDVAAIGPATDIYALGAILYEMITGQPPFNTQTTAATLWRVVHEEAAPPSRLRPHLPRDLETICLKCLDKDPRRRYGSARLLADDLQRYLAGLPLQASPAGPWRRLMGRLRAHPTSALLGGVGSLALLGGLVGLWLHNPLAVAGLAALSLCLGAGWYHGRLERALFDVRQQNAFAQRSVERMHLLLDTVDRLLAAPGLDQRLRILGEAAALLVNAERATIFLVDQARGELWSKLALGDNVSEIRLPIGSGIAGSVFLSGRVVNLSDPYNDARFNPEVDRRTGFTTRNLLTLPMTDAIGRRLGVFQVLNKRGGPFGADDVEILTQLARAAARIVL